MCGDEACSVSPFELFGLRSCCSLLLLTFPESIDAIVMRKTAAVNTFTTVPPFLPNNCL